MSRINHLAIIGMGDLNSGLVEAISNAAKRPGNDIIIVVDNEKPELNYFDEMCFKNDQLKKEQFKIESILSGEKKFICKGKHQYREVRTTEGNLIKSSWVCECGRRTND